MTDLLEVHPHPVDDPPPARQKTQRRTRGIVWIATGLLLAATLGYVIADQVQARDRYLQTRTALGATAEQTRTVTAQLGELRRGLSILETQVGSDSTALSQDSSQLLGAQTSLTAAKAHVTQQALLISSLKTCLAGVEQALNALAVGNQSGAIAALNAVSASCSVAEDSSG